MSAPSSAAKSLRSVAPRAGLAFAALTLVVVALGAYARSREASVVFVEGQVVALDPDSQYHLHRAQETLARFPQVPAREPLLNWPDGAFVPWGPGFDQLLALPAIVTRAPPRSVDAARAMVWVPVAVGIASILASMSLAWRAVAPKRRASAALAAGVFAALMPTSVYFARVGRTDHHGFEGLAAVTLATLVVAREQARGSKALAKWELSLGLALFACVHVYTGTVLTAGLATLALALRHARSGEKGALAGSGAPAFLGAALALVLVDSTFIAQHRIWFHELHLSYLQPSLLAVAAGVLALVPAVGARARERGIGLVRGLTPVFVAVVGVAAVAALVPPIRARVIAGLGDWLLTRDPWMANVAESRPLFAGGSLDPAYESFGFAGPAFVLALPIALRTVGRANGRKAASLGIFCLALAALTVLQNRFGRVVAPLVAAALGIALDTALARLRPFAWLDTVRWAVAACVALALALSDPKARDTLTDVQGAFVRDTTEAAWYLRFRTPSPGHPPRPGRHHGVLTNWSLGHAVLAIGERPVMVAGFGPYPAPRTFREVEVAFSSDGETLSRTMDRHDAGHVFLSTAQQLDRRTQSGRGSVRRSSEGGRVLDSRYLREMPVACLLLGGSGAARFDVPHLDFVRPVFASRTTVGNLRTYVPGVLGFERVRGAVLEGAAEDGTRVIARVPIGYRDHVRGYEAWTIASGGRFRLRMPIATGFRSVGGIVTGPTVALEVGSAHVELQVPEGAVIRGDTIPVRVP